MFEDITAEEERKAIQLMQLLENTSKPGKCYLQMRENINERQCANIAYDSISVQLMKSIPVRLLFMMLINHPQDSRTIYQTYGMRCYDRIRIKQLGKDSEQQKLRKQAFRQFIFIVVTSIFYLIGILLIISSFILDISKYGVNGLFIASSSSISHTHQPFLIDTMYLNHPIDISQRLIYRRSSPYSEIMLNSLTSLLNFNQYAIIPILLNGFIICKIGVIIIEILAIVLLIKFENQIINNNRHIVRMIHDQGGPMKIIQNKNNTSSIKYYIENQLIMWKRLV